MSRVIDPEGVLTEDEVKYLEDRGRQDMLARNAAYLINRHAVEVVETSNPASVNITEGDVGDDGDLVPAEGEVEAKPEVSLKSLNKPELVALAEERGLDAEGTKEELIARLEAK